MVEENAKIVPYADGGQTRYFLTCPKCGSAEDVAAGTTRCPGCGNPSGVAVVDESQERAEFEAWVRTQLGGPPTPDGAGGYAVHELRWAWMAWKAARGVMASEAPHYEQCGEAVVSPEYGVLQLARRIGFLALSDDDRMRGHHIEPVYRRVTDGVAAVDMTQPDCWAILTPNGSRLVPPDEAKGRKDAYPLYTAETVAAAYQCGLAAARGVTVCPVDAALSTCIDALDALTDKVDRTGFADSDEFAQALDAIAIGRRALGVMGKENGNG